MNKKKIKLEWLAVSLFGAVALLAIGAGGMFLKPAYETDQVILARFGNVAWPHGLHAELKGVTCKVCHHKDKTGVTNPKPCLECHKNKSSQEAFVLADMYGLDKKLEQGEAPDTQQAFHAKCIGCHKAKKEGPVGCRDCHEQSFTGSFGMVSWGHREHSRQMENLKCTDCHHKDNEAQTDADYRACGQCHKPVASLDVNTSTNLTEHENVKHGECSFCHSTFNPESGVQYCTECHINGDPNKNRKAGDKVPPSIEQVVHQKCLACHNSAYEDLEPGMPVECTDCHKTAPSLPVSGEEGPLIWSHSRHSMFVEWSCDKCHHNDVAGEPQLACFRCHGKSDFAEIPTLEDVSFKVCGDCHIEKKMGPDVENCAACHTENKDQLALFRSETSEGTVWWSHARHADNMAFSCRECHHNTIVKDGKLLVCKDVEVCPESAGDPQACSECHVSKDATVVGSVMPVVQNLDKPTCTLCQECHKRLGAGPVECKDCHVK